MILAQQFIQPKPVTLFGEPIQWTDTACYLGVTLDKRLTWSPHTEEVSRKTAQRMGLLGPLLYMRSEPSIRNRVLLYKQLIHTQWTTRAPSGDPLPAPMSGGYRYYNPSVFALLRVPLGTSVTGRFTRIWVNQWWPLRLTRKPRAAGTSRPVEAIASW
jgi:hypothetical protein